MALFVAADVELPLVPWIDAEPAFNVQPLSSHEARVLIQFSKPHVRYLGAHTGCSCGFSYSSQCRENDQATQSVASLRAYLHRAIQSAGDLELFACWEGDEAEPPDRVLEVSPDYFGGEAFDLPEKAKFHVSL